MHNQVRHYIDEHHLVPPGVPLLVGVSGGIDSMVLLHVLHALEYPVVCAHVNYRMRGAASDADEQVVMHFCQQHNIQFFSHRVTDHFLDASASGSFQEHARVERYTFFERIAVAKHLLYMAVAHHQEDQAETVLMHLMRGSGVEGLAGMSPWRKLGPQSDIKLIRPLLNTSRDKIQAYAADNAIPWREDESNLGVKYLRNQIRHGLIADIRNTFGQGAIQNIARSAAYMHGYAETTILPALASKMGAICMSGARLNIQRLQEEHFVWQDRVILEALRQWLPDSACNRSHAAAIRKLLFAQAGRCVVIGEHTVWRDRKTINFVPGSSKTPVHPEEAKYLINPDDNVRFEAGTLTVSLETVSLLSLDTKDDLKRTPDVLLADAGGLQFPLVLRRWEAGDRFVPFGMKGQKKVSDLLTDLKISPQERTNVWVLVSEGEIIWVVGYRAGNSIKISADTKQVLYCRLSR